MHVYMQLYIYAYTSIYIKQRRTIIYIYIYGNVSINLCPGLFPCNNAQTNQFVKIFAGKKEPAAAITKNEDVNDIIFLHVRQKSVGKRRLQPV